MNLEFLLAPSMTPDSNEISQYQPQCSVFSAQFLGKLPSLFVLFFFFASREQRDHQLRLSFCPKHLATGLHLIRSGPL